MDIIKNVWNDRPPERQLSKGKLMVPYDVRRMTAPSGDKVYRYNLIPIDVMASEAEIAAAVQRARIAEIPAASAENYIDVINMIRTRLIEMGEVKEA